MRQTSLPEWTWASRAASGVAAPLHLVQGESADVVLESLPDAGIHQKLLPYQEKGLYCKGRAAV